MFGPMAGRDATPGCASAAHVSARPALLPLLLWCSACIHPLSPAHPESNLPSRAFLPASLVTILSPSLLLPVHRPPITSSLSLFSSHSIPFHPIHQPHHHPSRLRDLHPPYYLTSFIAHLSSLTRPLLARRLSWLLTAFITSGGLEDHQSFLSQFAFALLHVSQCFI